jgi:hypothetical protein
MSILECNAKRVQKSMEIDIQYDEWMYSTTVHRINEGDQTLGALRNVTWG